MVHIICTLLALCLSCQAGALRVRAERIEGGSIITSHGTATLFEGALVTAAHVVELGDVAVETPDGWIKCRIQSMDSDTDIAVLKPSKLIETRDADKDGCYASVRGAPVKCLKTKILGTFTAEIEGFDHGGSGSPIYSKGKLVGICTAMQREKVKFVPAVLVKELVGAK